MGSVRQLGAWDCTYCGTKRIMGNIFDCPGCSHPRPKGVRFYQIPDGPIVTPEIAKQLGSGGPNWYCEHCNSGNRDNETKCMDCGAPRGSSPSHEVKTYKHGTHVPQSTEEAEAADPDHKSWVDPTPETAVPVVPAIVPEDKEEIGITDRLSSFGNNANFETAKPFLIGAAALVVIALLGFLVYQIFFNTHEVNVQVSGYSWTQNVIVEEYQVVHESSWTSHPAQAYNVVSDYRDTGRDEKVHDGWDTETYTDTCYETETYTDTCTESEYVSETCTETVDNGDGSISTNTYECGHSESRSVSCTKTREKPYSCQKERQVERYHYEDVYDYHYEYDINKWMTIANYPTSGNDHEPYFYTSFTLNDPYDGVSNPRIGQQRQFQVTGKYGVTFFCQVDQKVGDKGYFSRDYSLDEWNLFNEGVGYPITVNVFHSILSNPSP